MLDLIIWALLFALPVAAVAKSGDDNSSSSSHKSHESIRVYPSERRAIRYYNGEMDEYRY